MAEYALTVIRMPPATPVVKSTKAGRQQAQAPKKNEARPYIFQYDSDFANKYGINDRPSNEYLDYLPPAARQRLRDNEGSQCRKINCPQ